jgi:hypothetical protein
MKRAVLAATVAAVALIGACGGDGGSTTAAKADPASDKAAAEKINLKASDLPAGWTSSPHQTSPEADATNKRFAECIGSSDPKARQTVDLHSPDFSKGQTTQASSEVQFVRTDADAKNDLAALQGAKTVGCIKTLVQEAAQRQLPAGTSASNVQAEQLSFPTLRDGAAAFRVSFTVAAAGLNVPVYADAVFFRAGRAELSLTTVNAGSPFDANLEKDLAKKMADRA